MTQFQNGKTYRLTQDVTNPKPDRRQRHDWRAEIVIKKGTEFMCSENYHLPGTFRLHTGRYSHQSIDTHSTDAFASAIVDSLELVDSVPAFLAETQQLFQTCPEAIFQRMLEVGTITRDQVTAFARVIDAEEQAQAEAKGLKG